MYVPRYPHLHIMGCTIRRGSLLLTLDIIASDGESGPSSSGREEETGGGTGRPTPVMWLQWLGLPWHKDGEVVLVQVRLGIDLWGHCTTRSVVQCPPWFACCCGRCGTRTGR